MNIFESLENLQVSEGCFEDIIGLVEEYISEYTPEQRNALVQARKNKAMETGRQVDIAKAALRQSEEKDGMKFHIDGSSDNTFRAKGNLEKAQVHHRANQAKLNRAQSLVRRLNNRRPVTQVKYTDGPAQ